ncbi:response regulator [Rubellimicrobium arenae]|uniref:response regulator n=1 Tax=Rubellimicrobium arenae TaxID=2817372 RepID=UPI001B302C0B|nr:response regulator [Rubellimicrobium arenae]
MSGRVLVVDDEPDLRSLLRDYLPLHGFEVRTLPGTPDLERVLREGGTDVVVLDVNMPGETGTEALSRLRAAGIGTPVILLTAAGGLPERVDGLGRGADDYVVKPFEPRELVARLRAVLRRVRDESPQARPEPRRIRLGSRVLDLDGRRLLREDGTEITLTAMEFDLLSVLAAHPRRPVSRERLAEVAHGRQLAPGDRSIDIRMLRLRRKIEPDPENPRILVTQRGEGYLLDPDG